MNDYYTYAYLRKDDTPYYVGKGRGDRVINNSRRTFKCPKDKSRILFLKKNLSETDAFKHERYMISILGRKDLGTGILHNKTDGGEGLSGLVFTDEHRINLTLAALHRAPRTDNQCKRISVALKGKKKTKEHAANNGAVHRKPITLVHTVTEETKTFSSGKAAAKALGLHETSIAALRKGKLKTHKGWRTK